jgi:broad specificity phosphatase PhoE
VVAPGCSSDARAATTYRRSMARLTLIRHGEAAAAWGDDLDPGLSELGRRQSDAVAHALAAIGPMPILVSPLRRTLETARPLTRLWRTEAAVEPRVGEIRTPDGLGDRTPWLRSVMAGVWSQQDPGLRAWADGVVDVLLARREDTVIVSHFVAINVAVGRAIGDDRVICVRPGNCSRTVLDNADGALRLVEAPVDVDDTDVL